MKNKKIIIIFSVSIIISLGLIFKSETLYLFDLVKTISKTKRIVADITDYKFFDNIDIPKSENPQAWPLHEDFNKTKSTNKLNKTNDRLGTVAFLIIKNDSLWYEKYYDGYSEKSYSNSFSIAKSIVTAVLGRAIDEGFIKDLNQKVGDFIPEYKN